MKTLGIASTADSPSAQEAAFGKTLRQDDERPGPGKPSFTPNSGHPVWVGLRQEDAHKEDATP